MSEVWSTVSSVIVDYHAGQALAACIDSLHENGVRDIVVVENGDEGSTPPALEGREVTLVTPRINLGYGRGVNRGVAATKKLSFVLVSNPDVVLHEHSVARMGAYLEANPGVGIVGPQILRTDGSIYPSQRVFPNFWLAGLHALLSPFWPTNPATRRYRLPRRDGTVDWVSGACFMVRRDVFEIVGGFDERYFMFAEDMALCWQIRKAGWSVATVTSAEVTHVEGLSRSRAPRAMIIAHHRSALRFEWQTSRGFRRLLAPLASVVLGLRLFVVLVTGRYN